MKAYSNIAPYDSQREFLNTKISNLKDLCDFFLAGSINKKLLDSNREWVYRALNQFINNHDIYFEDILSITAIHFSGGANFRSFRNYIFESLRDILLKKILFTPMDNTQIKYRSSSSIINCNELTGKIPMDLALINLITWVCPTDVVKNIQSKVIDISNDFDIALTNSFKILMKSMYEYSPDMMDANTLYDLSTDNLKNYIPIYHIVDQTTSTKSAFYSELDLQNMDPSMYLRSSIINKFTTTAFAELRLPNENVCPVIAGAKYCPLIYETIKSLYISLTSSMIAKKFTNISNIGFLIDDLTYALSANDNVDMIDKIKEIREHFSFISTTNFCQVLIEVMNTLNRDPSISDNDKVFKYTDLCNVIQQMNINPSPNFYHCDDVKDPDKDIADALNELSIITSEPGEVVTVKSYKDIICKEGASATRNKYGKLIFATEASASDKSAYKADKRIKQSVNLHEAQNKVYKTYKTFKTNEDKIDSQLTKIIRALKNKVFKTDPEKARTELIEGNKWTVFGVLKKVLAGAAIFSVSKVLAIVMIVIRFYCSKKVKASEKKKILIELDNEIAIVEEKINDAQSNGDRKAKYELMRIKNSLVSAKNKITSSYKGSTDVGLKEANKIIGESRGVK